jgi:hypothetical protein
MMVEKFGKDLTPHRVKIAAIEIDLRSVPKDPLSQQL